VLGAGLKTRFSALDTPVTGVFRLRSIVR